MIEFWEAKFAEVQTTWGFEPCDSAMLAKDVFVAAGAGHILIPGIGYGRNAGIFLDHGMRVDGIEISRTAVYLARQYYGNHLRVYNGSVTEMPFNDLIYDGIFCYALIHLLNLPERRNFIGSCYSQLKPGGNMFFTVISKKSPMYGTGKQLSRDRYQIENGLQVFFYDQESVKSEFGRYGLEEFSEMDEPVKHMKDQAPLKCLFIRCKKE